MQIRPRFRIACLLQATLLAHAGLALASLPALALDTFSTGVSINDGGDTTTADLFVTDVSVLDGEVCVGNGCTNTETFDDETVLKIRDSLPGIEFHDSSTVSGFANRDWRLLANRPGDGGLEAFSVEDITAGTIPFTIEGDAPENALFLTDIGQLGLGTSQPGRKLHVVSGNFPAMRFEQDGSTGLTPQTWDIQATNNYFSVIDITAGTVRPFKLYPGQPENLLVLKDGQVGIGTSTPAATLMVRSDPTEDAALVLQDSGFGAPRAQAHFRSRNGIAKLLVEEIDSTVTPRTLLELQNNGRPEIVMGNSSTSGEWSFGAGTNFVLKQGAVGTASSAKTKLFEVQPSGNAVLTGSLTTGGPTCGAGCDAVFSQDYDLPSIAEHAEAMFTLGHLPNVGPTVPGAPLNMSERYGTLLNELEHAHIYIAQQDEKIATLKRDHAARLAVLEAQIATLLARE